VKRILTLKTFSAEDTAAWGRRFAKILKKDDVVLLEGALGGGKTTFVKGIVTGLGYTKRALSPTFSLIRQYDFRSITVHHLDLYRLSAKEAASEEFHEYLYPRNAITLIEWGDKVESILDVFIKVEFYFLTECQRKLIFSCRPSQASRLKGLRRFLAEHRQ